MKISTFAQLEGTLSSEGCSHSLVQGTSTVDFDSYKDELKCLYRQLCEEEKLIRIHEKNPLCFSATEWGDRFPMSNPKVLFIGKANNGAHKPDKLDVDKLFESRDGAILSNGGGLKWIQDKWSIPNKLDRCPCHSPFFRVLCRIAIGMCEKWGWLKSEWFKHVAYGNFAKCNIDSSQGPSLRVIGGREKLFTDMLKVDLKYLAPDFVVCFTGSKRGKTLWFSDMFLRQFDAIKETTVHWNGDSRYCIAVYKVRNTYFLVTEHPQGKPEESHAKTVCSVIEKIMLSKHD